MVTYAVAHLHHLTPDPAITEYLERIDATLLPFGGQFVVYGTQVEVLEGLWQGDLIIIEFPDRLQARLWYTSTAYQAILPLRTSHAEGNVIMVDRVGPGHRATDVLAARP
ncbi:DUF1330 domain-containing protein [Deinococcus alpinitundrae]|uniref:DUF1330 domain-containing protein n=1 Tax=Deinococcus alpinitundrae TaxID=468913 RepID=UPI00137AB3A2|nr:DUF1330 domain-containing protein [Deinococcus alpinitundrae]